MASPPFNLDITDPADNAVVSQFPANERAERDNLNSYLGAEHDINTGYHKHQELTTTAKNALTTPPTGMLVYDTTLGQLQINTGTSVAPVWTTVYTPPANLVSSDGATSVAGDVPKYGDTTGKLIKEGYGVGTGASNLLQLTAAPAIPAAVCPQYHRQYFIASGTFTTPAGTGPATRFCFRLIGGGAPGSPTGGGGAGAEARSTQSGFSSGTPITITVGAVGGSSSISGSGVVTVTAGGASALTGGSASGGDLNIRGQDGVVSFNGGLEVGGAGGSTSMGQGGGTTISATGVGSNGLNAFGFGSGGGGCAPVGGTGGAAQGGIVIVEWVQ